MGISPTGAMEALNGFPLLELVIQLEAWSAAHHLGILGCWSYLQSPQGKFSKIQRNLNVQNSTLCAHETGRNFPLK
jgi:hypothetical protein